MATTNYVLTSNGNFISEDELYHWGIKGMKWGLGELLIRRIALIKSIFNTNGGILS